MDVARQNAEEQAALWNGRSGSAWVDLQDLLDRMLEPLQDLLIESIPARSGERVLDVGCGTGSTTLAIARRIGTSGRATGIDISQPMIELARSRAEHSGTAATFIRADAQTHDFELASHERIVSRLGVMFFGDFIAAFSNLRRAAKPGAELRVITWRAPADNPFMTTAERAAAPLLPGLPPRRPDAPGQFALADPEHVRHVLQHSGWSGIRIEPIDVPCALPESELPRYVTRLGPLGRVLPDIDEAARAQVIQTVRAAFQPFVHGDQIRFTNACWMVTAVAAAAAKPEQDMKRLL